jgi:antitoxin component HigA of HigAB toxin-antitoxin module
MDKKSKETEKINFENVTPIEFLRVLLLYGMKRKDYCDLRGKKRHWWNEVLNKRQYLTYLDIETLANDIGVETFNALLAEVRKKYATKSNKKEN